MIDDTNRLKFPKKYIEYKNFLIDQLSELIKEHSNEYYEKIIINNQQTIDNFDVLKYKQEKIEELKNSIKKYQAELNMAISKIKNINKWYTDLFIFLNKAKSNKKSTSTNKK